MRSFKSIDQQSRMPHQTPNRLNRCFQSRATAGRKVEMVVKARANSKKDREGNLIEAKIESIRDLELVEARREQLLDAALELFLQKGYASTTIRDICGRSGINPASIYDYVANKQDILRRLLNNLWFRSDQPLLPDRLAAQGDESLEQILNEVFKDAWGARRKSHLLAYRTVPHLDTQDRAVLRQREERLLGALTRELRRRTGAAADDKRVEVVANFITYVNAFGPFRDWLSRDIDEDLVRRTVVSGLLAMIDQLAEPPQGPA